MPVTAHVFRKSRLSVDAVVCVAYTDSMPSTVKRHNIKRIEFDDRERLRLAYGAELKFIDTRPYHHIWGFIGLVRIDMREMARRAYGVAS